MSAPGVSTIGTSELARGAPTDARGRSLRDHGGSVQRNRLSTDAVRQILLKRTARAGLRGTSAEPISPHGLRAGFVATSYRAAGQIRKLWSHAATTLSNIPALGLESLCHAGALRIVWFATDRLDYNVILHYLVAVEWRSRL
jgi:hypothetical protein